MKVKYLIPVLDFESGEIELTPGEETRLHGNDPLSNKLAVLESIADRLHIKPFNMNESAIAFDYAQIQEVGK